MNTEQPKPTSQDMGKSVLEFAEADEYSELAESLSKFDEARQAVYTNLGYVMQGEGGDTRDEAFDTVARLAEQTANNFDELCDAVVEDNGGDVDSSIAVIANIYDMDEKQRLRELREHNNDVDYIEIPVASTQLVIRHILEGHEARPFDTFAEFYAACITQDITTCLEGVPDNIHELQAKKRQELREKVTKAATETGKMAVSAVIAAVIIGKFKK